MTNKIGGSFYTYDGSIIFQMERGRDRVKVSDITFPILATYNANDRAMKSFSAGPIYPKRECLDEVCNETPTALCILFDMHGINYFTYHCNPGFRGAFNNTAVLGCVIKIHPAYDQRTDDLREEIQWLKADIKKLKANIYIAKKSTLIRMKKGEIWELKEEIKRLKREGKGKEKIEEPKAVSVNRTFRDYHSTYFYPYRLDRERVKLKSIEEYRDEIRRKKQEMKRMKEKRKAYLKERIKAGKEWLKSYREEKKKYNEIDKSSRIRELRKRWKEAKRWYVETSLKKDITYRGYRSGLLDEETQKNSQNYIFPRKIPLKYLISKK